MVLFHPDNERLQLYSAADDYQIRAWGLEKSRCIAVMDGHYSVVTALQVSADGLLLYRWAAGMNRWGNGPFGWTVWQNEG